MLAARRSVGSFWKRYSGYSEVAGNGDSYRKRKAGGIAYSNAFHAGVREACGPAYWPTLQPSLICSMFWWIAPSSGRMRVRPGQKKQCERASTRAFPRWIFDQSPCVNGCVGIPDKIHSDRRTGIGYWSSRKLAYRNRSGSIAGRQGLRCRCATGVPEEKQCWCGHSTQSQSHSTAPLWLVFIQGASLDWVFFWQDQTLSPNLFALWKIGGKLYEFFVFCWCAYLASVNVNRT